LAQRTDNAKIAPLASASASAEIRDKVGAEVKEMIRMEHQEYIRTAYRVDQKSIKQICRETGHSRETMRKVLRHEPCGYTHRVVQPYPVLGPYLQVIDQWLRDDRTNPKKKRHTAKQIYDRLVLWGFFTCYPK
jgi:hypothetical protein